MEYLKYVEPLAEVSCPPTYERADALFFRGIPLVAIPLLPTRKRKNMDQYLVLDRNDTVGVFIEMPERKHRVVRGCNHVVIRRGEHGGHKPVSDIFGAASILALGFAILPLLILKLLEFIDGNNIQLYGRREAVPINVGVFVGQHVRNICAQSRTCA